MQVIQKRELIQIFSTKKINNEDFMQLLGEKGQQKNKIRDMTEIEG